MVKENCLQSNLIKKTEQTGSIGRKSGSGCPRSAQTSDNI